MASLTHFSFFGLFLLFQSFLLACNGLPCPLEWEPASSGSIPDEAVESGPGEYVARIFLDAWYVTRINPRLKKISAIVGGKEVSYENYEVLINPHHCVIKWIRTTNKKDSPLPDGAISTVFDGTTYVGRGKYDGYQISGTITERGLEITHKGKQTVLARYEIITAVYSKLYGSLSNIKFSVPDDFYENAHQELIGSSLLEITLSGNHMDTEKIYHEKVLNEKFIFEEHSNNWAGISSLQVSFYLWFGTSDVDQLVQINGKNSFEIVRPRKLTFSKDVLIVTNRNDQVCTFFLKPGPKMSIDFEATAQLTADGDEMTVQDIADAVEATGRTVDEIFPEAKIVTTQIVGTVTGRFALDVGSKEFPVDRNNEAGKCGDLNEQPKPKSFN